MKKRIICIIMAGVMTVSMAACGSGAKDAASPEAMESVEASEPEEASES